MSRATAVLVSLVLLSVPTSALAQPEKFSLTMFHYNIQYVAGGLRGFPDGKGDAPDFDLDDAEVQDRIIVESFEPVLDIFLAHPTWGVDLEMQAYMVEVMRQRHPKVLAKLKQLVQGGQAELVSFHWSDQLFLAYPRLDLERSFELMEQEWERAGIEPSPVVFCQEGQFGVGMARVALAHGRSILVLPMNLFKYQHLSAFDSAPPLFELDGVDIVLGARDLETEKVQVQWSFFDDGELLATSHLDPYMGTKFARSPEALDNYEKELEDLESQGFRIATVGQYVDWAKKNGVDQKPLPPVLDGTWQPQSTDSMHRWMGASGLLDMIYRHERDNAVLTRNVQARHLIQAAETLVEHAESQGWIGAGALDGHLSQCWRDALLAQVSDASGINPFINEVLYGLNHALLANICARQILEELAPQVGGPLVQIDPLSEQVQITQHLPEPEEAGVEPLVSLTVDAPGRTVTRTWHRMDTDDQLFRLMLSTSAPTGGERTIKATFPLKVDGFHLTPGLVEDRVDQTAFSALELQEGRITLPVANGLIGLDRDLWLIKQTSTVHIGATFEPAPKTVTFEDQTLDPKLGTLWIFWFFKGSADEALAHAARLNLHPMIWVRTEGDSTPGCGCGIATTDQHRSQSLGVLFVVLFVLLFIWFFRRSSRAA